MKGPDFQVFLCEEKDFSMALFLAPDSTLSDAFCINSGFQEAFRTVS